MEQSYQVLSDVEHLKKRKAVYLGEVSDITKDMYTYDDEAGILTYKTLSFNTGLLKLFDEIFSNAIDNYQRTTAYKRSMKMTEARVEFHSDHISILNDGQSIPIRLQEIPGGDKVYIPQMIFTLLRSGSNFDDTGAKRTWGGMNGMGCKIVSFLSHKFVIELLSDKTFYYQEVLDSTSEIKEPVIHKISSTKDLNKYTSTHRDGTGDYTKITYYPIFSEFDIQDKSFTNDFIDVCKTRIFDVCYLPINLYINDKLVPRKSWSEFVQAHADAQTHIAKSKSVTQICVDKIITYSTPTWNISFSTLNPELKTKISPVSYVNYIFTQDGGTHVNYVVDQLTTYLKKKYPTLKSTTSIKDKLFLCVSAVIPNPKFESQAKNRLTTSAKEFGDDTKLPNKHLVSFAQDTPIVEILEGKILTKKNRETKGVAIASIPKAKDATYAGTAKKAQTRLILTEGDSALTTAVHGVEHIKNGVDYFGMFPLRGKSLNVRANSMNRYLDNAELTNIKVLLGLEDGKKYTSITQLRYGGVILMTDADTDGAHIKSLIINFFDVKFPSLLQIPGFIREFITPMIKVTIKKSSQLWKTRGGELDKVYKGSVKDTYIYPLYNRIEFSLFENEFLQNVSKEGYEIDYIKGLATIEKYDTEQYFDNMDKSEIKIAFDDAAGETLDLAFSKRREDDRKEWIGSVTEDTHLERKPGEDIICTDFINTDLCLYSFDNCVRSIPSLVDGLKPTQRKILCTMLKMGKKAYNKIKVTELGGLVTKDMKYEHGDVSMNDTIIGMAQDFAGSNNINLLIPIGQFGTRRQNGDDHGSPRYVHTSLNPLTRYIFPEQDDVIYDYKPEEGEIVEPVYYVPIIPMVLVNGAKGIGTGWSTEIPGFNPVELTKLVLKLVNGEIPKITALDLPAYWNGFGGKIVYEVPHDFGNIQSRGVEVRKCSKTEKGKLPRWVYEGDYSISTYKGLTKITVRDASPTSSVEDIYESINKLIVSGDDTVLKFVPSMFSVPKFTAEFDAEKITEDAIVKMLNLNGSISATNMVLFNGAGQIKRYSEIYQIIEEWSSIRYECYEKRIAHIITQLERELLIISNKYRFVKEIAIDKTLYVNNKKKSIIEGELDTSKYDKVDGSYSYLLSMPIYSLTKEKLDELKKERDNVSKQLEYYRKVSVEDLWSNELKELLKQLTK